MFKLISIIAEGPFPCKLITFSLSFFLIWCHKYCHIHAGGSIIFLFFLLLVN